MQYMLLIYGPEPTAAPSPEAVQTEIAEYNAFTKEATDRKLMIAGEGAASGGYRDHRPCARWQTPDH